MQHCTLRGRGVRNTQHVLHATWSNKPRFHPFSETFNKNIGICAPFTVLWNKMSKLYSDRWFPLHFPCRVISLIRETMKSCCFLIYDSYLNDCNCAQLDIEVYCGLIKQPGLQFHLSIAVYGRPSLLYSLSLPLFLLSFLLLVYLGSRLRAIGPRPSRARASQWAQHNTSTWLDRPQNSKQFLAIKRQPADSRRPNSSVLVSPRAYEIPG